MQHFLQSSQAKYFGIASAINSQPLPPFSTKPNNMSSPTLYKISVYLVLLLFISPSLSIATSSTTNDPRLSQTAYTPELQAERLIRSLNLFPNETVNIRVGEPGFVPGKIVEKKFSFFGANYGPSVEDLGHHAGYYSLPHSRAAR